ncbi:MAG: hypothetical protein FLDDKLPJ_02095 [Phycisphaerae bacterium]|nr:hypothetical protein [Phycisphaerae bacterium]
MRRKNTAATRSPRGVTTCVAAALTVFAAFSGGCQTGGASTANFAVRPVPGADEGGAFQAARDAMLGLGFQIALAEPDRGRLESAPAQEEELEFAARSRTHETGRRQRRVASVRIETADGDVKVFCRVEIQEPSTEAHRFRASVDSSLDRPGETPIDRDAATTPDQNTVWRTIGRDRDLERSILDAVTQLAGASVEQ